MGEHPSVPQTTELDPDRQAWLNHNRARIENQLAPLNHRPDGMLCLEMVGSHFATVIKDGSILRLGFMEQGLFSVVLVQSHIDLRDPLSLLGSYTQVAMLGLLWVAQPRSVYVAGLGGGRLPTVLHHHFPAAQIECAELDGEILSLAITYFGLTTDDRLRVSLQDGREYLVQRSDDEPYDFIFIDVAFGNGFVSYPFVTQEFYRLCRSRLSSSGILVINLLSSAPHLNDQIKTLEQEFDSLYVCRHEQGNILIFAPMAPEADLAGLKTRARSLQAQHRFSFPFLELAEQMQLGSDFVSQLSGWEEAQILNDAEPPQDYFVNQPAAR